MLRGMEKYFISPALSPVQTKSLVAKIFGILRQPNFEEIQLRTEYCVYVAYDENDFCENLVRVEEFLENDCHKVDRKSFLNSNAGVILEFGPRLNFTTAYSTNAVSALKSSGLKNVKRLERSIRYQFINKNELSPKDIELISSLLHDKMTECQYKTPLQSFDIDVAGRSFFEIDILRNGKSALIDANQKFGLALDDFDIDYYYNIFAIRANRNPTNVELFDLAQSNSEHSRHWFFKGRLIVDGQEIDGSLFKMVMRTQNHTNQNSVIKFKDNSSAIRGSKISVFKPSNTSESSSFLKEDSIRHITYTAETHNFPTGICPFPGAATGTGGRIRDGHATGRGSHVVAGVAGYSFGNLNIPGFEQPWEAATWSYPFNFAKPLEICIQASNGASDYGNKFGEPVICGFARSFGMRMENSGERIEYVKPIMFSGGMGTIDDCLVEKIPPKKGMIVAKIGGPIYRIGVGGGSASSVDIKDAENRCQTLDFSAVQRGDAQMEQKLNRAIRSCVEMGAEKNPILSIHDQGAGGNGNVLKEIVENAGATIYADKFELGDPTINALELWGAEYQESDAILMEEKSLDLMIKICKRERCPLNCVGETADDNKIILVDFHKNADDPRPVDMDLDWVLGAVPRKTYNLTKKRLILPALSLPKFDFCHFLKRVLCLPSVASKRYLTNKVDRCVTGLIAQQQCVGCLHTPLADVAATALSYFDAVGSAVAVGEQPIKMLISPEKGARMSVGEALTNLVFAPITDLKDVKCSANWMWAAKMDGEGEKLYAACKAMCDIMAKLGIAVDGGKDSLSMAALLKNESSTEVIKSPGTLVISAYAQCTDIRKIITPDLKCPSGQRGILLYINFGSAKAHQKSRLGGSALAQCFSQLGDDCPDLDHVETFIKAFKVTQHLIKENLIASGHDISDGGLITAVLEMAFAGNCSVSLDFKTTTTDLAAHLFNEELGGILEVEESHCDDIITAYEKADVFCAPIGYSIPEYGPDATIDIHVNGRRLTDQIESLIKWRSIWEETSFHLEKLQCNPLCVESENQMMKSFVKSPFKWNENLSDGVEIPRILTPICPKLAVLREEGTNGDREMAAAFFTAGFQVFDLCMQDLLDGPSDMLEIFDGLAFAGGFSYADVFGAAKGWASCILHNEKLKVQFENFRRDKRKFSFGACNGCQLMTQIGWVGDDSSAGDEKNKVYMDVNESGRFESRFCYLKIEDNNSIMLENLAGSILGVWVAHGEGRFTFKENFVPSSRSMACRYVDWTGQPTNVYPMNPNGSALSLAGLCSSDGRHLAMMPHPERSFLKWQWPHCPSPSWKSSEDQLSPWMKMFTNAYNWCTKRKNSHSNGC